MITRALSVLLVLAFSAQSAVAQSTDSTSGKSVLKGVYSAAQATRGEEAHQTFCTACHAPTAYTGDSFKQAWVGRMVFDLFDRIRTTMPDDNPGGLTVQQYTDIITYILKLNGYPAGTDSLPADPEPMRVIKIEAKP